MPPKSSIGAASRPKRSWKPCGIWSSSTRRCKGRVSINSDFRDLFVALNAAGCKYLLVGGYALAAHGIPRFTKDLDIWIQPEPSNAGRVIEALGAFGAPQEHIADLDLTAADTALQIGVPPSRIDILTAIDGVTFDEAWAARAEMSFG